MVQLARGTPEPLQPLSAALHPAVHPHDPRSSFSEGQFNRQSPQPTQSQFSEFRPSNLPLGHRDRPRRTFHDPHPPRRDMRDEPTPVRPCPLGTSGDTSPPCPAEVSRGVGVPPGDPTKLDHSGRFSGAPAVHKSRPPTPPPASAPVAAVPEASGLPADGTPDPPSLPSSPDGESDGGAVEPDGATEVADVPSLEDNDEESLSLGGLAVLVKQVVEEQRLIRTAQNHVKKRSERHTQEITESAARVTALIEFAKGTSDDLSHTVRR